MKVVIVGAGLSGLCTAMAFRKCIPTNQNLQVKVYDNVNPHHSSDQDGPSPKVSTSRLGAGLGLQANGLRVLGDLDHRLREKVCAYGFPCTHFTWKTAGNYLLGREYLDVLPISRPLLINCLQESLPEGTVICKKVSRVLARQGQRPVVQFEDGSPDEIADLVIGADGIRSTVRRDLFGDNEKYRPEYSGICAVGGVLDMPLPQHLVDDPTMIFFTGPTGVFGYSGLTQSDRNKLLYWSVYETDLPDRGAELDHDVITRQLRERHSDWADPLIGRCLRSASIGHVFPIFVMPDLPYWGRDGCVLIGDAAHALPSRTGQGASQAFEDAEALALLLAGYLQKGDGPPDEAVSRSILGLFEVRAPRVRAIRADGLQWKQPKMPMSWLKTCGLYAALFLLIRWRNFMNLFKRRDAWNAKEEVTKYINNQASSTGA
ncbi:hypothetical protein DL765_009364 [Monosporascus sp. GIB2]|nr:hypothetical protein DL765_009364 [Monosporascus sp. GIB2]